MVILFAFINYVSGFDLCVCVHTCVCVFVRTCTCVCVLLMSCPELFEDLIFVSVHLAIWRHT